MTNLTFEQKLQQPIPFDWRINDYKGQCVAYIDSRACQNLLDEVVGVGGWQSEHFSVNGNTYCKIGIKIQDEWIWKSSSGESQTDIIKDYWKYSLNRFNNMDGTEGEIYTKLEKEIKKLRGELQNSSKTDDSDAFKRACYQWGIGRFLYSLGFYYVKIDNKQYKDIKTNQLICTEWESSTKLTPYINSNMDLPNYIKSWFDNINTLEELKEFYFSQYHFHKNKNFIEYKDVTKQRIEKIQ